MSLSDVHLGGGLRLTTVVDVLKFEYLSQLLLDSNYIPLVLKLFAHQDIQQVVDSKTDRTEHRYASLNHPPPTRRAPKMKKGVVWLTVYGDSFFHFCNLGSKFNSETKGADGEEQEPAEQPVEEDESEDDAAPPPIRKHRAPPGPQPSGLGQGGPGGHDPSDPSQTRPEVDELGYPLTTLPEEPITDFSRRNFFSMINYLRIMQKMCKKKAHRNLLLVQYKSSTIIRKSLKVPQPELRLYTLKLFKNQVPYCGRKWRQGNMRVITAVYLHCRPELRDEWLAGSDVDAEVDSALPLEQALRSLTHWLNLRRYPEGIAPEIRDAMRDEQDFFTRELEKLNLSWNDMGGDDGMSDMDHVEGWA